MYGEIYLWRDRHDPETILVGAGREYTGGYGFPGDDRDPDVAAFGAWHQDALYQIFGDGAEEVLAKLDQTDKPVCFTLVIPEL